MTLEQWSAQMVEELRASGFSVSMYHGFPLVAKPEGFEDGVRLLKLQLSMPVEKRIYAEGALIVPAGSPR